MSSIQIKVNAQQLARLEEFFLDVERGVPVVISRALNKTGGTVRSRVAHLLRDETGLKISFINRHIILKRATTKFWLAIVRTLGGKLPLIEWVKGARQTKKGVTFRGSIPGVGRELIEHAFIARQRSGGRKGIFIRQPGARMKRLARGIWHGLPIRQLWGPSLVTVLSRLPRILDRVLEEAGPLLEHYIVQQMEVLLEQRGRNPGGYYTTELLTRALAGEDVG